MCRVSTQITGKPASAKAENPLPLPKKLPVRDLAKAEAINESYLGRVLRLTLLSPSIIEAILEGLQPANLDLDGLFKQFPIEWDRQLGSLTDG